MTPAEQFREVIYKELGVAPAVIVGDGRAHRFSINGNRRDDAGEYRFYDDKFPAGFAKDYRHGIYFKWSARDDAAVISASDRAERDKIIREREEQRRREQAEAARIAQQRWQGAKAADPAHGYLTRKGVQAHGLRQEGDTVLVPVLDGEEIISVQSIGPDGRKLFQLGSRVKGGFFTIGDASDTIYICEGYATAATIYDLTGQQTIVAFNAGNILPVAQKIRASNPQAYIVICADDDYVVKKNPGVAKATEAAKSVNGYLAIPPFDRDKGEIGTDFNDLAALRGSRAVQDALDAALAAGTLKTEAEQQAKKEQDNYNPPGEPALVSPKFALKPFEAILFDSCEEWLIKRLLPRQGVGVIYGASQSFKSFVASHVALYIALGWPLAGRRVWQASTVYIAAEGAAGLPKRKVGFEKANKDRLPSIVPFYLVSVAPNLGTGQGDLAALIASIEAWKVAPGLIVLDTLAQSLGAGDENGAGMIQLLANATSLANYFKAFVLIVHHIGLSDDKRMRGHSSLIGGIDAQILCERKEGEFSTDLTLQKLKDEASNLKLTAHLERVVICQDEDGEDISTLVVGSIENAEPSAKRALAQRIPRAQRLLMAVIAEALEDAGESFRSFVDGPLVRAVRDEIVKHRLYARIAEQAAPGESAAKLAARQRQAFSRDIAAAIKSRMLIAGERNGERLLWFPRFLPTVTSVTNVTPL